MLFQPAFAMQLLLVLYTNTHTFTYFLYKYRSKHIQAFAFTRITRRMRLLTIYIRVCDGVCTQCIAYAYRWGTKFAYLPIPLFVCTCCFGHVNSLINTIYARLQRYSLAEYCQSKIMPSTVCYVWIKRGKSLIVFLNLFKIL